MAARSVVMLVVGAALAAACATPRSGEPAAGPSHRLERNPDYSTDAEKPSAVSKGLVLESDEVLLDPSLSAVALAAGVAATLATTELADCPGAIQYLDGARSVSLDLGVDCPWARRRGISGQVVLDVRRDAEETALRVTFHKFVARGTEIHGVLALETGDGRSFSADPAGLRIRHDTGSRVARGRAPGPTDARVVVLAKRHQRIQREPGLQLLSASPLAPLVWIWFYR